MQKVKPLYMCQDFDDDAAFLAMKRYGQQSRLATDEEATTEAMADMLDQAAESCNAHDFVGCHARLAKILEQEVGPEATRRIIRRLVNYEGLHGLSGVCGEGDEELVKKELEE